ncbi:MAG: hypothetical protein ACJ76S_13705 [Solirubrobacteraceae bacterium]
MGPRRLVLSTAALAAILAAAAAAGPASARAASLDAYRGPGAWVDIYSGGALSQPEAVVRRLAAAGVKTLYLETANWRRPRSVRIVWPAANRRFIVAAHARGMRVVAWYLPGLSDLAADRERSLAAIRFRTPEGQGFDGFALDIESSLVAGISARNAQLMALSRQLRAAVGRGYTLGAIIPDARSTAPSRSLWPGFPYRALGALYDVFLPMAYSTYRVSGASSTYAYTRYNIARIRAGTGRPGVPVHVIGGLADGIDAGEARAVVAAARASHALGVSFYNVGVSGPEEYAALRAAH